MAASFAQELPDLLSPGWGPTEDALPSFSGLPFTPFSKRDSINYIANWDEGSSSRPSRSRQRRPREKFGSDKAQLGVFDDEEEEPVTFTGGITVKKKTYETIAKYRRMFIHQIFSLSYFTIFPLSLHSKIFLFYFFAKYKGDRTGQQNKLNYSQNKRVIKEQQQLQNAPTSRRGTRRQVQNKRRRKKYIENPRPTVPSIKKHESWIDLTDIWFRETFEQGNNKSFIFKIDGNEEIGQVYTPRSKKLILAGTLHGVLTKYDTKSGTLNRPCFPLFSAHFL